ncbi:prion-like-(Q/N-rich) domain-bearing protein 25 isoform X2 [Ceratina calcarata]|uniref:Prion-like-(Q/N-rich) domain-bearing protein 25 isoform X2 n=1 Tax=Ceratina calcarata TaxID=156304 RepID=A0AAJ7JGE3_9HYME|nr:prion-like-(Q/N-rich) domain-bearing protein 25 isoform X2 [Ceratina calcarata]XP_017892957.1 prion-like-(Q/N-rich) domain-bearing protein 25 isoform X2 [Ceratina calcarata]
MTLRRTVPGLSRLLVLVPVTVCVSISYVDDHRCNYRTLPPQTLAKCRYDDECMNNAYCWNQEACLCKDGYIVHKNGTSVECLKVASAIGDPCVADVQCRVTFATHSECKQNICQCSDGSHYVEGRCYESVGLGQVCQTNRNCYIKYSYCVTGFCACTLNYHPNPRNDGCVPNTELGEECMNDYECVTENSRCMVTCSCKVDHIPSRDGKRCLKAANSVGEPCEEHSQCLLFLKHAECGPNGTCTCVGNYHRRGPVCVRSVELFAACKEHRECVTPRHRDSEFTEVPNVNCIDGMCVCANDYILSEELRDCIGYSDNGAATTTSSRQIGLLSLAFFLAFLLL